MRVKTGALAGLTLLLAACGGGGGGGGSESNGKPAPPAPALAIQAPAQVERGEALSLSSNAPAGQGLSWDFGDGSTSSSEAQPQHAWAQPGDYLLRLKSSGGSEAQWRVAVLNTRHLQDLDCNGAQPRQGWCQLQAPLTLDLQFADALQAWRSDSAGGLWSSGDAGRSWQRVAVPRTAALISLALDAPSQTRWALARDGELLRQSGGGAWSSIGRIELAGITEPVLRSLGGSRLLVQPRLGGEQPWYSEDGGAHWIQRERSPQALGVDGRWWATAYGELRRYEADGQGGRSVMTLGPGMAWSLAPGMSTPLALRITAKGSELLRSMDGGLGWMLQPVRGLDSLQDGGVAEAPLLQMVDGQLGYLNASGRLYRTSDGGLSWELLFGTPLQPARLMHADAQRAIAMSEGGYWVWARGERVGRSLAEGLTRGLGWKQFRALPGGQLLAQDYDQVYYLGSDGLAPWQVLAGRSRGQAEQRPRALAFAHAGKGFAVASDGRMLRSADGGRSWSDANTWGPPWGGWAPQRLQLDERGRLWVLSLSGTLAHNDDVSLPWRQVQFAPQLPLLRDFEIRPGGWAYGLSESGLDRPPRLLSSSNGGLDWQLQATLPEGAQRLRMRDAQRGLLIMGDGSLRRSIDGGRSWTPVSVPGAPRLLALQWLDEQVVLAVGQGGAIVRSADAGQSWAAMSSPLGADLLLLAAGDARHVWAAAADGRLAYSEDAGQSWQLQHSGLGETPLQLLAIDAKTVWLLGEQGGLVATGSAGQ
ncbi:PKD domain-containing protein [Paucibacter soli]|uniref:PKD domain-containing protein n=1 Tax=Paucibacter soli TaxID=3133433 RepID=UPI00309B81DF